MLIDKKLSIGRRKRLPGGRRGDPAAVHGAPELRALLLAVRGDWYALPLAGVREVLACPVVTPVPTAPAPVMGVLSLRGEIVPVLDTAVLLGLAPLGTAPWCVVADTDAGPCALATDTPLEADELSGPAAPGEGAAIIGTYEAGRRLVGLLDPAELTASVRGES